MTDVLHTIRINYVYSIMFVNRMREMLCKEIEKDGFCPVMSVGQRKNSESPWGIAPQTFGFLASDALPLSHRDSMVNEVYYKVHMTHILHTAGIRNEHWSPESKGLIRFLTGTQNCFFVYWHLSNDSFKALTWNKIYLIYCMITSDQSQVRSG